MAGGWLDPGPGLARTALRAFSCVLILLPATAALGATLPFMAEAVSPRRLSRAGDVARAYALNTAGALLGVVAATAVLLVEVGVRGSGTMAASISAGCGLLALAMARRGAMPAWDEPDRVAVPRSVRGRRQSEGVPPSDLRPWVAMAAVSGAGTLALQVLYTRMFALTFHNSTYTFGLVMASFIGGLAIGSAVYANVRSRWEPRLIVAWSMVVGSAGVAGSVALFSVLTGLEYFSSGSSWWTYLLGAGGLVALVVTPPVALLGLALPACWEAAGSGRWGERQGEASGSVVGWLSAANAVAAAVGALVASFVLLPTAGLWASFGVASGGLGLAGLGLLVALRRSVAEGFFAGLLLLGWIASTVQVPARIRTLPADPRIRIVASWEGPYGRTEVVDARPGVRILRHDLHYGLGSTGEATVREYRQGLLPLLLHPDPREVLFLGLGTGLTAGPAVLVPEVERVGVVELIPEVVEAARLFQDANFGVLDHPKVEIRVDDARHDLLASRDSYDVIVSDLFVPWESKAGYLYTTDFYRVVRDRLAEGGLFCQWLPLYQLGREEFMMISDSFASVFPHASLWWGALEAEKGMVALVGSDRPVAVEDDRVEAVLPAIGAALEDSDVYLGSATALRRLRIGSWPAPDPGALLNTDEHPRVEFRAPIRQRDDRLLVGGRLLALVDEVFRALPEGPPQPSYRRRVWQRAQLLDSIGR
ncbi:fused MFS/spermidine synthase [Tautonia sociabilis]|uniref:Spermidine synthase n=1 Tax=Tautonia sociabilis TaxID=2080755 RepID=A0A432MPR5_9BACT|nr:fused MFS/spermidine synthase [Tautonia sociabilis]RUL89075.1 spermidine synthase [Tautonia sociabilis]